MEKENKKQNKRKNKCPLCEISEDTLKRLKEAGKEKTEKKSKKIMKSKLLILFLILIFGLGIFVFYQFSSNKIGVKTEEKSQGVLNILPKGLEVGDLAPDFVTEDVDGNKISLSDFRDEKPVLLIFWATWCGQCAKELPLLKDFTKAHREEIQVIAVDSGESKETLKNYIKQKEVNFLILLDEDRKIWNQYSVRGTPSHFLIDSSGKVVTIRPGLASREDLEIMMTMLTELW